MWLIVIIATAIRGGFILIAILVIALPVAGIVFLLRRSFILAGLCFVLFAVFAASAAFDWHGREQATLAFGSPQILGPINRGWPVVLANDYGDCSGVCRLFLLGRNKSVVYVAKVRRGRPSSGGDEAPIRAAYSLASGSACDSATLSNQVDMHDKAAGCIVAVNTAFAPANYTRVTVNHFPIRKIYDLGFPKPPRTPSTTERSSCWLTPSRAAKSK